MLRALGTRARDPQAKHRTASVRLRRTRSRGRLRHTLRVALTDARLERTTPGQPCRLGGDNENARALRPRRVRSLELAVGVRLQAKLAVRRLAASLSRMTFVLFDQLDRRGRDRFVDITAGQAGAIGAVPVTLYDHGTTAAGAGTGKGGVHEGSPSKAQRAQSPADGRGTRKPGSPITGLPLPTGLAVGFGLKGRVLRIDAPLPGRRAIHPVRWCGPWFPRPRQPVAARRGSASPA